MIKHYLDTVPAYGEYMIDILHHLTPCQREIYSWNKMIISPQLLNELVDVLLAVYFFRTVYGNLGYRRIESFCSVNIKENMSQGKLPPIRGLTLATKEGKLSDLTAFSKCLYVSHTNFNIPFRH